VNILLIEDERNIRKFMKDNIDGSDHQCITCDNCEDGLEMIRKQKFDLIFLDLTMPTQMQGYDLVVELNKTTEIKKLNIVIFSATGNDKTIDDLKALGIHSNIKKPVSLDVIDQKINEFLK